jgi:hypothetical protein
MGGTRTQALYTAQFSVFMAHQSDVRLCGCPGHARLWEQERHCASRQCLCRLRRIAVTHWREPARRQYVRDCMSISRETTRLNANYSSAPPNCIVNRSCTRADTAIG